MRIFPVEMNNGKEIEIRMDSLQRNRQNYFISMQMNQMKKMKEKIEEKEKSINNNYSTIEKLKNKMEKMTEEGKQAYSNSFNTLAYHMELQNQIEQLLKNHMVKADVDVEDDDGDDDDEDEDYHRIVVDKAVAVVVAQTFEAFACIHKDLHSSFANIDNYNTQKA